ncbi:unnamed protein product [Arabidopsis lyrata]|uniref:Zinc finger family protein n=1 Tax=Arabidopsis lyrata subsp. lyrata TaxID=81972 RepID=D7L5S0_ARALL|nr:uncharacterized protein LOC9319621 [Arabidopsis lyrata subsp. lyrata]XP_020886070.1 uncharacterized protein LOC9319621 [Arabidopsis lyrata subsp. lyrata]EFH59813.1 hypothetical protein ARALYDRAFT_479993 [Arabidopsis lyrata subsp. lyrata]CAH8261758.1 unnamed protein product [Arabidopsis lyrata]|eukprot:XP_020886069.1 uncharacterized protein LOC9319621 [Arabidopsis lyrata subsp. lyrata]
MAGVKRKLSTESDVHALHKELDEVSCPVCMDHPHNAVLLLCSSHDKGCRSYICDTSYRHSNCLDRFKKLHSESPNDPTPEGNLASRENNNESLNEHGTASRSSFHRESTNRGSAWDSESLRRRRRVDEEEQSEDITNLKCPLCRGTVLGWKVVEEVRTYLDLKNRSCSRESCSFTGNYQDLRRHARRTHPTTRPSDTDPSRERAWRHLENQREYGDIVSAIRSAMPGAVVVGDYVIENGDRFSGERETGNGGSDLWTTLVLFQMIGSLDNGGSSASGSGGGSRSHRSRAWRNHRRSSSDRRYLWGENLLGLQEEHNNNDDEELHMQNDAGGASTPVPRRRRRFGRPRSSGNHPR